MTQSVLGRRGTSVCVCFFYLMPYVLSLSFSFSLFLFLSPLLKHINLSLLTFYFTCTPKSAGDHLLNVAPLQPKVRFLCHIQFCFFDHSFFFFLSAPVVLNGMLFDEAVQCSLSCDTWRALGVDRKLVSMLFKQ